jgi:hypothetical protein
LPGKHSGVQRPLGHAFTHVGANAVPQPSDRRQDSFALGQSAFTAQEPPVTVQEPAQSAFTLQAWLSLKPRKQVLH